MNNPIMQAIAAIIKDTPTTEVPTRATVTELHSTLPHVRRFRLAVPIKASRMAPVTSADGIPKPGDPFPPERNPPEPDMVCFATSVADDSTETERAAIMEFRYERNCPAPSPVGPLPTDPLQGQHYDPPDEK